jgi:SNF2 family DNA or RNA helicase
VRVPMGKEQAAVYKFHLEARYRDINGRPAIGAQLQALRIAAANPTSHLLVRPEGDGKTRGSPRSNFSRIPKLVSCLKLIQQILERGEQVVVFSAFRDSLDVLSARLMESGVHHCVLDGRMSPKKRGAVAAQFKLGPPKAGERVFSKYPVMLAGVECMAEGHSFNLCNNVILMCYSWAYDKFEQAINRVHRINSRWDMNVYSIICEGSIDRKPEALMQEKGDAAELVLDGHLLGEHSSEANLAELLHTAQREFNSTNAIDERQLDSEWRRLRLQLGRAAQAWIGIEPKTQKKDVIEIRPILTACSWRQRLSVSRQ